MDNFETIKTLLSTLGHPIFEEVVDKDKKEVFYCKGKDAIAQGEYTNEGFVVLKNSICNFQESKSAGPWLINIREDLVEKGTLVVDGGTLRFTENYIFNSPSAAAGVVLARRANGWAEWKDEKGITLDVLKR